MRTDMTHTGPFYAVRLVFRDEAKPDVFGWEGDQRRFQPALEAGCFTDGLAKSDSLEEHHERVKRLARRFS